MARITHRAVDSLGDDVRRVIVSGFCGHKTAAAIAGDLKTQTGQSVAERTISREMKRLHDQQRRRDASREQARALLAAARDENIVASELIQALATQALMDDPESFTGQDAVQVQRANLEAEKIRLKRAEIELRKQQHELNREKFDEVKKRDQAGRETVEEIAKHKADGGEVTEEQWQKLLKVWNLPPDFGKHPSADSADSAETTGQPAEA